MILTIEERMWYDKFQCIGFDECNANLMARLKCLIDNFKENTPDVIINFKDFLNKSGPLYLFCMDSGRLTSDELNIIFHQLCRSLPSIYNPFDNPFSIRFNFVETLRGYFDNNFK